jgi:protein SCO1/2
MNPANLSTKKPAASLKLNAFRLGIGIVPAVLAALLVAFPSRLMPSNQKWASVQVIAPAGRKTSGMLSRNYGMVPDFALVERSGKKLQLADLRGKIWIADFIYTSCPDTCPLQTAEMARLEDEWKPFTDIELVSFSVDPGHDTTPVLAEYANRFHADPKRWLFATGDQGQITHLVQDGFRLTAASVPNTAATDVIVHSSRFVLVDRQARIRGYYDSQDFEGLRRLRQDVATLLRETVRGSDRF